MVSENNLQAVPESNVSTGTDRPDVEESEKEAPVKKKGPLTAEEFRRAWEQLRALGITWTADILPVPSFLEGHNRDETFWKQYTELQKQFPTFPRELATVIMHGLVAPQPGTDLDEKLNVIRSELFTHDYRADFFFKYAIKVPYLEDLDWEVVIKAHERGVNAMPRIAYALLRLNFRTPDFRNIIDEDALEGYREPDLLTVAVNEELIDKLIERLIEVRRALDKTQKLAASLTDLTQEENDNGTSSAK
jgi:hypothetical protein